MKKCFLIISICASVLSFSYSLINVSTSSALTGADWSAGRIIDDSIFRSSQTMTVSDIQNFLNSKMPSCDTWGTQPYGNTTRADYGRSKGNPPPYMCLKDYYENPTTKENNLEGRAIPAGSRSAAQLISDYAINYRINPQVLLVLLQKEQTLLTDDWPWVVQYKTATGYGCPDTAACDAQYYGFSNQVRWAARMYQAIGDNDPDWYSPYIKGQNFVFYNPSTSRCGGTSINIENWSTASLYSYTPYQPNKPALDNLYGTGDDCSAYGNRNFWRLFDEWFGSTKLVNANISLSQGLTVSTAGAPAYKGDIITATYEVMNSADYAFEAGGLGICGRFNGQYYDLGFIHQNTIAARGKTTVTFSKKMDRLGTLNLFVCSYNEALGGWASLYYPYNYSSPSAVRSLNLSVLDNPYLTTGISISPSNPGVGQPVTATMSIRNAANTSLNLGSMVIAGRDPNGRNVDFGIVNDVTIAPNWGTYSYSKTQSFDTPGKHTFFVANWNNTWNTNTPVSLDSTTIRQITVDIIDNPHISTGINLSPSSPILGQPFTASITLQNTGTSAVNLGSMVIAARDPAGKNVDFKIVNDVIVPPNGGIYTYSESQTFTTPGSYKLFVASWNKIWSTSKPVSADANIVRQRDLILQ